MFRVSQLVAFVFNMTSIEILAEKFLCQKVKFSTSTTVVLNRVVKQRNNYAKLR